MTNTSSVTGNKVNISGYNIYYEKVGSGPIVVLLLPGALGTGKTDFPNQLDGSLNPNDFTLIAWDPPGYGQSESPEQKFHLDMYQTEADMAAMLMKKLGYDFYCVIGWSDGARTALHLASRFPGPVEKLVSINFVTTHSLDGKDVVKDKVAINEWLSELKVKLVPIYGEEKMSEMYSALIDNNARYLKEKGTHYISEDVLFKVRCPCLIVHGDKDPLNSIDRTKYLVDNLSDAILKRFPNGGHNLHQTLAKEFNKVVSKFLLD